MLLERSGSMDVAREFGIFAVEGLDSPGLYIVTTAFPVNTKNLGDALGATAIVSRLKLGEMPSEALIMSDNVMNQM
jgi:hypothetical protein